MSDAVQQFDHEYFEELCALSTAGALTPAEAESLFAHLSRCEECARHFAEYQSLAKEGIPQLVDFDHTTEAAAGFNEEAALRRLVNSTNKSLPPLSTVHRPRFGRAPFIYWCGALAASLIVAVAFGSYEIGRYRSHKTVAEQTTRSPKDAKTDAVRAVLERRLQEAGQREARLEQLLAQRSAVLDQAHADSEKAETEMEALRTSLEAAKAGGTSQIGTLTRERDTLQAELRTAEQRYSGAQEDLSRISLDRSRDLTQISSLQGQIAGLTSTINDQNRHAKDDEQYLASDKDIRDLIGARNLYIADIMDVREDGSSRKPFGRVFYTKTKSLIFYAYDLDKQPGIKQASTFHVWGRTGANDPKPLNLGILYLDSETNRRWTLKVNNPEQLARLDAVFVTVESRPQTDRPTGKPFLYASLRREPNHP
jgi:hypothetical protein